jgi:anti-sigma-K factor RskA
MTDERALSEEDDVLAGEYVLGVLTLSERLSVEARIKLDTAFAQQIAVWENDFGPLNAVYGDLKAPNLLPKIEARLFPKERRATSGFSWFQFALGTFSAAMLVLGIVLMLPDPKLAEMTATLQAEAQPLVFVASYDGAELTLSQTGGPAPAAGNTYQLWLIAGDAAPVSLGLIDGPRTTRALSVLAPGVVLAVSLEPTGGSTTGAPTGPVLVTGIVNL